MANAVSDYSQYSTVKLMAVLNLSMRVVLDYV